MIDYEVYKNDKGDIVLPEDLYDDIADVIDWAIVFLENKHKSDAALHCTTLVRESPLCNHLKEVYAQLPDQDLMRSHAGPVPLQ